MSVLFLDGFDHYDSSTVGQKYTTAGSPTITATNARTGKALSCAPGDSADLLLGHSWNTIFLGVAVRAASFGGSGLKCISFFYDATLQVQIEIQVDGSIRVYRGTSTVIASIPTGSGFNGLQTSTWHYLEIGITFATAGVVHINIDGVRRGTFTNVNTKAASVGGCSKIRLHTTTGLTTMFDDMYVNNYVGAAPHNTFMGVGRVETLMPTSDGANTDWTPSSGSDHYAMVDESSAPNGDTDYISSTTEDRRDSFNFASLSAPTQQVLAVAACASCKQDSGNHTIKLQTRPSAISQTYDGSARALTSSYSMYTQCWGVNPATGGPWTVAEVNSAQFGIKLHATNGAGDGGVSK